MIAFRDRKDCDRSAFESPGPARPGGRPRRHGVSGTSTGRARARRLELNRTGREMNDSESDPSPPEGHPSPPTPAGKILAVRDSDLLQCMEV